ncbi:MAG: PASTA domain-containing protein [Lachnospiraceae bacterium]|nr:PASTA domain-containing protein [Lachnospiraceae bacterium]
MKCLKCFHENNSGGKCPFCGFDNDGYMSDIQCLQPGTKLKEARYTVGCVVGVGGFGVTYSAWDETLNIHVAIKEYLPGEFSTRLSGVHKVTVYGGDKQEQFRNGLEKFYEESLRLAKFEGIKEIVQIYDVFRENDTAYIVTEYLEGETLGERLKREEKLSVEESLRIIIPILNALEQVHKEGIIHRDIAPNNIFLQKDGGVKLLDFGAARNATGTHSKSLTVLYKEGYTAEEQYQSRGEQGPWTDVYSTAATLYRMLTGIVPPDSMQRRRKDQLKRLSACVKGIPKNIDHAVMNALILDIKNRTQNASQFKEELVSKSRVGLRYRRFREYRVGRIPIKVRLLASTLVIAAVVFAYLMYSGVIHLEMGAFQRLFLEAGKVRVMNVVNLFEDEAEKKLADSGLKMTITEVVYRKDAEDGRVLTQEEEKGSIVDQGSEIHVTVSRIPEAIMISDMVGERYEPWVDSLSESDIDCEVNEITDYSPPGYILAQSPQGGTTVDQGGTVSLDVSKGMGYDTFMENVLDDYVGRQVDEVLQACQDIGIYLRIEGEEYDDVIPKGTVLRQNTEPGSVVHGEDLLDVIVSLGIEQKEVPSVVGMTEEEAEEALLQAGFTTEFNRIFVENANDGEVRSQDIEAGTVIDKNSLITCEVAYQGIRIPSVIGLSKDEFINKCKNLGLEYSITEVVGNPGVISQSIPADRVVDPALKLEVNVGITLEDFKDRVVSYFNNKRAAMGLPGVTYNPSWKASDIQFTEDGHSVYAGGRSYNGVVYAQYYCIVRNNITSVDKMISQMDILTVYLPEDFSSTAYTSIGVDYSNNKLYACMYN